MIGACDQCGEPLPPPQALLKAFLGGRAWCGDCERSEEPVDMTKGGASNLAPRARRWLHVVEMMRDCGCEERFLNVMRAKILHVDFLDPNGKVVVIFGTGDASRYAKIWENEDDALDAAKQAILHGGTTTQAAAVLQSFRGG